MLFQIQTNMDSLTAVQDTVVMVEETVTENSINLLTMAEYGGWIMIVLALMLAFGIYLFIERMVVLTKATKEDKTFMDRIKDYIHDGEIDAALKLCKKTDTPASRLIAKGISRLGRPMNDVLVAIENTGNIEIAKLEKGFPWLATTAAGAPMIGFLGTVTGMVNAFYNMASAGNNADITTLSSGIYEALVTTIAGLVVGVIALFAYNYLVALVDGVMNQLETKTMEFMDLLNEPAE